MYVPVYLDIEDYLNTELPLDGGSLLIALAAGFVDNCDEADVPKQKLVDRMKGFLDQLEITDKASVAASAGPVRLDLKVTLCETPLTTIAGGLPPSMRLE